MNDFFRNMAVTCALAAVLVGCSGTQRNALLPSSAIAQGAISKSECPLAQNVRSGKPQVIPLYEDEVVWKSCIHNGDRCECGYAPGDKEPGVYRCESGTAVPLGIATGSNLLYGGFGNTIVVFNHARKVALLKGLTGEPIGLAVDYRGNVWAGDSPSDTISEFAKGATKPTATYTDSNLTSVNYLAVDASGDVYVEGQAAYSIEVDVLPVGGATFTPISQRGKVGLTPGGLAVQSTGKTTYVWINDQGTPSSPAAISRYVLKGSALYLEGSFTYSGTNGAIWADPAGKNINRIWAVNNVPYGSGFNSSAVEYAMPGGKVIRATVPTNSSTEAVGIAGSFQ